MLCRFKRVPLTGWKLFSWERKKNISCPVKPFKYWILPFCLFVLLWKEIVTFFFSPSPTDLCNVARGGCSHQCTVAPGKGVVCSCPPGLHLDSSNKTCQVVDYCTRHLKCSQVCEQYKTTVKCSCYPGWTLDTDGDTCHSSGEGAQTLLGWFGCSYRRVLTRERWV